MRIKPDKCWQGTDTMFQNSSFSNQDGSERMGSLCKERFKGNHFANKVSLHHSNKHQSFLSSDGIKSFKSCRRKESRRANSIIIFIIVSAALSILSGAINSSSLFIGDDTFRDKHLLKVDAGEDYTDGDVVKNNFNDDDMNDMMQKAHTSDSSSGTSNKLSYTTTRVFSKSVPSGIRGPVKGTEYVLAILVDFPDLPGRREVSYFNNLLFGNNGSMKKYYEEVSYGNLTIEGEVAGNKWYRLANSHRWYGEDEETFYGPNIDSRNTQRYQIAIDALKAADRDIDFSIYDKNRDGRIGERELHIIIIAAGESQSTSGNSTDLWPHRWYILNNTFLDGINVSGNRSCGYSLCTEESGMGTFAHEFGHDLGLPDLYDTSYNSYGVGQWCLMGYGSYGGNGSWPSHLSPWCKIYLGWLEPVNVSWNYISYDLPAVEIVPEVLKLYISRNEYFLVENRQKAGFDKELPGAGLLIWHIDDSVGNVTYNTVNSNYIHKRVDLEEADDEGLDEMLDWGSKYDPWYRENRAMPSSGFTPSSNPSSYSYIGLNTYWAITNISALPQNAGAGGGFSNDNPLSMNFSIQGRFNKTALNKSSNPYYTDKTLGYLRRVSYSLQDSDGDGADERVRVDAEISAMKKTLARIQTVLGDSSGNTVFTNTTPFFEITSDPLPPTDSEITLNMSFTLSTSLRGLYSIRTMLIDNENATMDESPLYYLWLENTIAGRGNERMRVQTVLADRNYDHLHESILFNITLTGPPLEETTFIMEVKDFENRFLEKTYFAINISASGNTSF
ncbi:MAG: M6 family metalloprotease domain-containing protein, partial [Thermoplasmata archaeon]